MIAQPTPPISENDQAFWSYYARHVQALVERAEESGRPLWEGRSIPKPAAEYTVLAVRELKRCMVGGPKRRQRSLNNEAKRFHRREGGRGGIPWLSDCFAAALRAKAEEQVKGAPGNPTRKSGQTAIRERHYANQALQELIALELSKPGYGQLQALLEQGSGCSPSRGRRQIAERAVEIAHREGVVLSKKELGAQIREIAKVSAFQFNVFALFSKKPNRIKRQPKKRLIKISCK